MVTPLEPRSPTLEPSNSRVAIRPADEPDGRYAGEDIGGPSLRVDAIHLGCDDQAVHGRGPLSATIRATTFEGYASQPSFSGVVGEARAAAFKHRLKLAHRFRM
jgi:hypothetical protein